MPQGADLEELAGLGAPRLGPVDDHDGAVDGHERAVGVLGEVLVAGGVQDVDAEAVVLELQHRGRDGDAALLLNFHPVGGGGAGALALDLAGLGNGAAVQQEFFRQGRLAGVRVRDDAKVLRREISSFRVGMFFLLFSPGPAFTNGKGCIRAFPAG